MTDGKFTKPVTETPRGSLGDARPDKAEANAKTRGSLPQEDVENRPNVSTVTPEDYPAADREISRPK